MYIILNTVKLSFYIQDVFFFKTLSTDALCTLIILDKAAFTMYDTIYNNT